MEESQNKPQDSKKSKEEESMMKGKSHETFEQEKKRETDSFRRLLNIMDELREKCPWDHKQTFESLRANTIEEVFELTEAIEGKAYHEVQKELGDVLLHIVFYAKIASEQNLFDMADVCDLLCEKLIRRHPHIYGDKEVSSASDVEKSWEQIKIHEKDGNKRLLSGVPKALPSLIKAYRIQDKVRNVGFDWAKREDVWAKVKEEIKEFEEETQKNDGKGDAQGMEDEFGDVLFSLINAARLYKINPDNALEKTNRKFTRRFNYIEDQATARGKKLDEMTIDEMNELWEEAKKNLSPTDDANQNLS